MEHVQACLKCGSAIDTTVMNGECPTCLIEMAVESGATAAAQSGKFEPPSAKDLDARISGLEVIELIGRGGMGAVYRARQTKLDRNVALKILSPRIAADPSLFDRFLREAKTLARLHHPHVVTAFDVGEIDDMPYLVMEYVDGRDAASLIAESGTVRVEQAVDWTIQAARGLEFAHRNGVIHRDVKPANLLIGRDGTVKILDLGLARIEQPLVSETAETALTQSGHVMGTADFMAPEQAADTREAGARSDIYGLGCTLYYLLTGKMVYQGDTLVKKIFAHRDDPVPSLCEARPDVPPQLDAIFQAMVAKRPEDRPQGMSQVIERLQEIGQPVAAPAAKARPPHRNRRWLAAGLFGALLVLAAMIYRVQTDRGTLIVQIDEAAAADIETRLAGGGIVVVDTKTDSQWTVKPGDATDAPSGTYRVKPPEGLRLSVGSDDGLELETDEFKLKRGEMIVVRVTLISPPAAEVSQTSPAQPATESVRPAPIHQPAASTDGSQRAAARMLLDAGQVIGVRLDSGQVRRDISAVGQLPAEPFEVISDDRGPPLSEADIDRLAPLFTEQETFTFGAVASVDSALRILSGAVELQQITVFGSENSRVTGQGLAHLHNARNVQSMTLGAHNLVDADVQAFTWLRHLNLTAGKMITGSCLSHLTNLIGLELMQSSIDDAGLVHLRGLTNLEHLSLDSSNITDAGLEHLGGLANLTNLNLAAPKITDAGLVHLQNLQKLSEMSLAFNRGLTDAGLVHLENLQSLRKLNLDQTQVTRAGVERLQRALPACKITQSLDD